LRHQALHQRNQGSAVFSPNDRCFRAFADRRGSRLVSRSHRTDQNLRRNAQQMKTRDLNFGAWSLFGVWCLVFGVFFLVFGVSSLHGEDTDDPSSELSSFQIADGFEVRLFASEKDGVVKPIQIRFDARGRLWVIGSTVYPQIKPGEVPNDKVLILEDTQGRGYCDKVTTFADGLMIPTGIEVGDGGA